MKKRGFTLSEVLITLGIIGVVASLTAPSLVTNSRNQSNASKLSVIVSNLENAFSNAITQENAENLYGTSLWAKGAVDGKDNKGNIPAFVGNLGRYLVTNGFEETEVNYYNGLKMYPMNANGSTNTDKARTSFPGAGQCFAIEMKNGATIFIRTYGGSAVTQQIKDDAIAAGVSYYTNAADVFIDVNGRSAPNTFGRDIFAFQVGENGILYPLGGRDVAFTDTGKDVSIIWSNSGKLYSCTDTDKGSDENNAGLGCTARIISEGYKMNY